MVGLSVLDRKVLRDALRLWAQVLAIAMVLACGVMTIVLAVGAFRSLDDTRRVYYDHYRFGHVFAQAVRAPASLANEIAAIDGVSAVSVRIVKPAILDIAGMDAPATGLALSVPSGTQPAVNRLFLRDGRLPSAEQVNEVALDERFARAHGFAVGDTFLATISGRKLTLRITAIVLSPEFVYALGPGDIVPDDRRYAVFYMGEQAMAGLFDMQGSFNDVAVRLMRGGSEDRVMEALDAILDDYGGAGSFARDQQTSHAFLDSELTQLNAMARVIPPVFLFVSAFLVNMILSRLIALEREQIGLLKACGYSSLAVAWHYAKLVMVIAIIGLVVGGVAGTLFGQGLTRLYQQFFSFPFLIFRQSLDLYAIAAAVSVAAALAGAAKAIWSAVVLPPAVAMRPPAPQRYRSIFTGAHLFSQLTTVALRQMMHRPLRTALTTLGLAMAVSLLVTALFSRDSIDFMVETVFFRSERADARLAFSQDQAPGVISAVRNLPGVISAEIYRSVPVILRNGHRQKRMAITGRQEQSELSRVLDRDGRMIPMPSQGILLTERLAGHLGATPGTELEVELIEQGHRIVTINVSAIVEGYVGLGAHMRIDALDRLVGDGPRASGAWVDVDENRLAAFNHLLANAPSGLGGSWPPLPSGSVAVASILPGFLYVAVKQTPALGSIALQAVSREKFQQTIEQNIDISMQIYAAIAVIIAFGVVYNSARIQLSERARELASLRVLGFTRAEVSRVLLTELAIIVLAAQPLGWLIGYLFALSVIEGFASDLFSIPLVIYPATYAWSSIIVLAAAAVSTLLVIRRVANLDLIRVLKTRE